jgi:hypothetical protein
MVQVEAPGARHADTEVFLHQIEAMLCIVYLMVEISQAHQIQQRACESILEMRKMLHMQCLSKIKGE